MLARALSRLALRRPVALIALGLALATAGIGLATRLSLETDLSELLPHEAPSVVALHALGKRVGGTGNVAIAIESLDGTPQPLRAYIPELVRALRRDLGKDLLSLRFSRTEVESY